MPNPISKTPVATKKPAVYNRDQFVRQASLEAYSYALGTTERADTKNAARLAVRAGFDLADAYEAGLAREAELARKAKAEEGEKTG